MNAAYFLTTVGLVPYFASRALLPLFITALVLRFGPQWDFLASAIGVAPALDLPPWATSNVSLYALGAGALLEGILQKDPTIREKLSLTESQLKAALAVALCLVLAPESQVPPSPIRTSLLATAWLGAPIGGYLWAMAIGGLVWLLANQRVRFVTWLAELDDDDDLGIQRLMSWFEDLFGVLGVFLVFLVPLLAVGVAVGAVLVSWVLTRWGRAHEHAKQVRCISCQTRIDPCAPHCHDCRAKQPTPRAVGFLGRPRSAPAGADHHFSLKRHKRCVFCGTRVQGSGVALACRRCNTPVFSSRQAVEAYLSTLAQNTPPLLLVLAAFGAIPILGLFAGVLFYRLTLVASVRQYAPSSARIFGRWLLRGVNGLLLLLQPVPVLGVVVLPLMGLTNVWFYTRQVRRAALQSLKYKDYSETLKR